MFDSHQRHQSIQHFAQAALGLFAFLFRDPRPRQAAAIAGKGGIDAYTPASSRTPEKTRAIARPRNCQCNQDSACRSPGSSGRIVRPARNLDLQCDQLQGRQAGPGHSMPYFRLHPETGSRAQARQQAGRVVFVGGRPAAHPASAERSRCLK